MAYAQHILWLIGVLVVLLVLFVLAFWAQVQELWVALMFAVIVVVGVLCVLARWGGGLGRTD
jgi:hypothetical protein